ncbi:MAG TPA: hypothetical protein PLF09_02135 [Thiotrichales bacterium]|nr:hypothetical protein [Thiotrichales bacterium]
MNRLILPKHKLLTQAYLSLGELNNALESLEAMCRYSNDYFIVYAQLASLMELWDVAEFAYRIAVQTHVEDELTKQKALRWAQQHQRESLICWLSELV